MSFYRRPKFLEILHEIREEMSREADYDVDLFAEKIRSGESAKIRKSGAKRKDGAANIINKKIRLEKLPKTKK